MNPMMKIYEAIFSQAENLVRLQVARRAIERAGGKIKIAPPTSSGMVLVTLMLPDPAKPQDFLPGLPFYAV
jgi:hypothetical protein